MQRVILALNPFEPTTWEAHDCDDVRAFLVEKFDGQWPDTARIYHEQVATVCDVTPADQEQIDRLAEMPGPFYVLVYPADPITLIVAAVAVIAVAATVFLVASIPNAAARNDQATSPNNELANRSNQVRVNGRIPDIFGQVRSTPDLLAVPYKVFDNNKEVEVAYMCVGRGSYEISDIRDDTTPLAEIAGTAVDVYGPGTSPNQGVPEISIGPDITWPLISAKRSNAVNGQTLNPVDYANVFGAMRFIAPNKVELIGSSASVFTGRLQAGAQVALSAAPLTAPGFVAPAYGPHNATLAASGVVTFTGGYNPSANFAVGDEMALSTANYGVFVESTDYEVPDVPTLDPEEGTGVSDGEGSFVYYNVSRRYIVTAVSATTLTLEVGGGWAFINEYFGGSTSAQPVTVTNYGTGNLLVFSGTYLVTAVTDRQLTLSSPATVNPAWDELSGYPASTSPFAETTAALVDDAIIGPITIKHRGMTQLYFNFVALGGLYKESSKGGYGFASVAIQVTVTPLDANGDAIGGAQSFNTTIDGVGDPKLSQGRTFMVTPAVASDIYRVTARRTTPKDTKFDGQVVDEVKWRDCYGVAPVDKLEFGDVTTVMAVTYATDGALALKERKLNLLATRKVPQYGELTYATMTATGTPANIIITLGQPEVPDYLGGALLGFEATAAVPDGFGASIEIAGVIDGDPRIVYTADGSAEVLGGAWQAGDIVLVRYHAPSGSFRFFGVWAPGLKGFGDLAPTKRADDIIAAMCFDPFIGNRPVEELDVDNLYDTVAAIVDYFDTEDAAHFCYTFDKDNLSFEETVTAVASAIFCTVYRRGRLIKLSFERQTDDSTLLFNHRNKLPGTEVRTVRFGYPDDIDGVEYTYVDPDDDAIVTKYLPDDQSAINPKKVESIGVRSHTQAHFHINRVWNKLRFQNTTTEFGALQQAEMLVRSDRILVADNTRGDTLDGEVLGQNGLELVLSQPIVLAGAVDHVIFLQHTDGTIQAIDLVSVGPVEDDDTTRVVLAEAPSLPLALQEDNLRVNTGYVIVGNDAPRSAAFLVAEREPQGNFTSTVTAINYDDRYYQNDYDFAAPITADNTIASTDLDTRTIDAG